MFDPDREAGRLTNKNYPSGSGMTNVSYGYDSISGGNYGKGKRTSMRDYFGTNSQTWKYDNRGRLISETKTIDFFYPGEVLRFKGMIHYS